VWRGSELNTYHNVSAFRIPRRAGRSRWLRCRKRLRHVVSRHDVLRTSVELTGYTVPMQLVHETSAIR